MLAITSEKENGALTYRAIGEAEFVPLEEVFRDANERRRNTTLLTRMPLTKPTSKMVGTTLNTNAERTKLMPLFKPRPKFSECDE